METVGGLTLREALADAEARCGALIELSLDGICLIEGNGRIERANDTLCRLLERDPADVVGHDVYEFLPPDVAAGVREGLASMEPERASTPVREFRLLRRDGSIVEVEATGRSIGRGDALRAVVLVRPVEQRKQVQSALEATRQRLHGVFDALAEGIVVQDHGGLIIDCNPAACRILGLNADQMAGLTSVDPRWHAVHEDGSPYPGETHPAMTTLRTGQPSRDNVMGVHKPDGSLTWISINSEPLLGVRGTIVGVVTSFADVSDAKRAARALEQSEIKYRSLVQQASDGIFIAAPDGRYTEVNDAGCAMLGYTREEILGLRMEDLVEPAELHRMPLQYDRLRSGAPMLVERRMRRKDGSILLAEINARMLPDGQFLGLVRDVGQRKAAEDALRAKEVAERSNRAKSEFVSRMSHELRTPLNAILGFSELLQIDPQRSLAASQRDQLELIRKAGRHLLTLIDDLLDLSRIEAGTMKVQLEDLDIEDAVRDALDDFRAGAERGGVALSLEVTAPPLRAQADRTRLRQVVMNLVSNAVKYNRPGGHVTVRLAPSSRGVRLSVIDDGPGMTLQQQRNLFQPFNRLGRETSPVQGTGIGLVITRSLVELMGGAISVRSEPGRGSVFDVDLPPAHAGTAAHSAPAPAHAPVAARSDVSGRVLYIEDDEVNRMLMQAYLALRPGVELTLAVDGRSGIEAARTSAPDLVLIDMSLPDMRGLDVLRALREPPAARRVPCIAVSAEAMPEDIASARAGGMDGYITKPLPLVQLLQTLDAMLQSGRPPADVR